MNTKVRVGDRIQVTGVVLEPPISSNGLTAICFDGNSSWRHNHLSPEAIANATVLARPLAIGDRVRTAASSPMYATIVHIIEDQAWVTFAPNCHAVWRLANFERVD